MEPVSNPMHLKMMRVRNPKGSSEDFIDPGDRSGSKGVWRPIADNEDSNLEDQNVCMTLWSWFNDSILVRLFSSVLTLQAAIMWIAFALNFILTLLFAPFDNRGTGSFISSWLMTPGITFFSAHFFWFVFQIAAHSFSHRTAKKLEKDANVSPAEDALLIWVHSHINIVRSYRFVVCCVSFLYLIVGLAKGYGTWNAVIAPLGQVPLAIMYSLLVLHILAILIFAFTTLRSKLKVSDGYRQSQQGFERNECCSIQRCLSVQNWKKHFVRILLQVVIPLIFQIVGTVLPMASIGWGVLWLVCFIWILWFLLLFPPVLRTGNEKAWCCGDQCLGCLSMIFSCMLKRKRQDKDSEITQRFIALKLFVIFSIVTMASVLAFIYHSNDKLVPGIKVLIIIAIIFMWLVEFLLLLPHDIKLPCGRAFLIRDLQSFTISISNVIVAIMMFVGFIMMLVRQPSKAGWMLLCMLAPALFHLAVCVYSFFVDVVRPCRLKLLKFEGVDRWLESHFRVSLYPRVYYIMCVLFLVIGVIGLTIGLSVYYETTTDSELNLNETTFLHGNYSLRQLPTYRSLNLEHQDERTVSDLLQSMEMKMCQWQVANLTIQDMVLFTALAYQPKKIIQQELDAFYNESEIKFTLDEELSHYNAHGYGDVTYFTAHTENAVIVSIRGTTRLYDWLVNLDTWAEALVYQTISILFPWSKLFPEFITERLIRHMSILERLMEDGNSTRSFVRQMIHTLKTVETKHITGTSRKLIVVGHSLGGGLTKLAGIALNSSQVLVSVSGPGISYSHNKDDETQLISMESINRRTLNIYNDRDVVPWIDKQEGLTQLITCPSNYNFLQCHYVRPTFCNVMRICGNPRRFKINPRICKDKLV